MFREDEEGAFGLHGFKLVPTDGKRRCWWLKAEDEEEKKDWEEVCMPMP